MRFVALGIIYRTDIDPMRASTYLGCEVRDRPRLTSFYQASMSLQRQRSRRNCRLKYPESKPRRARNSLTSDPAGSISHSSRDNPSERPRER